MASKKKDVNEKKTKNGEEKQKNIGYFQLYRFATGTEILLIFLAFVATVIRVLMMVLLIITYAEFTSLLVDRNRMIGTSASTVMLRLFGGGKILTNATWKENSDAIIKDSIAYGILIAIQTFIQFICAILSIDLLNYTALKQISRIRKRLFDSTIQQEIGWHDDGSGKNFALWITDEIEKIREGIGEKVVYFLNQVLNFLICVALSFYYGWKLSCIVVFYIPILLTTVALTAKFQTSYTVSEMEAYANAGSLVEEVLKAIRTVIAFGGQKEESKRYNDLLNPARKAGFKKGISSATGESITRFIFFVVTVLCFWIGTYFILDDRPKEKQEYNLSVLLITFFGLIVGADNVSKCSPFLETFSVAKGAAKSIYNIIARDSKINPLFSKNNNLTYTQVHGNIEFRHVTFQYPSRDNVDVLCNLSMSIKAGQKLGIVGSSGSGKSTTLQLIQRFYDPSSGRITIDGIDIRDFNICTLRSNVAVVGQEPILFSNSIAENIRYGKPDATDYEIESAAKRAGVHHFITTLPNGYQTNVGEFGSRMSGGQRQRIAIARAIIQDPKILLLDEPTSALDYESEKLIQKTLDEFCIGRTTIIVSHRLSAVKNCDRIICMEKGKIIENGTHDELVELAGHYYTMVQGANIDDLDDIPTTDTVGNEPEPIRETSSSRRSSLKRHSHYRSTTSLTHHVHFIPVSCAVQDEVESIAEEKVKYWKTLGWIVHEAKPEWLLLTIGVICAMLGSTSFPVFSILMADYYGVLQHSDEDIILHEVQKICIILLVCGVITGVAIFLQTHIFNYCGIHLAGRMRFQAFSSMLNQEIAWFDDDKHAVGALSARLAGDTANVQGVVGYPLSQMIQAVFTFVISVIIAFNYNLKLVGVCLAFIPFFVISVVYEARFMGRASAIEKEILETANKISTEAIQNVRTVASLRLEPYMIDRYNQEIDKSIAILRKKNVLRGLVHGIGSSIPIFGYGVALYYGGILVATENVSYAEVIKVSEVLLFGGMMLGQCLTFAPAFTGALVAGHRLHKLIKRKPRIVSPSTDVDKSTPIGDDVGVLYKNIEFRYPKRPDVPVLQGLNLEVLSRKRVALVGPSGCGKSTCIQLLQRFYDPDNGKIMINGYDIANDMSLHRLRSFIGIVSQEPSLFNRSIAENIAFGDASRNDIPMHEIIQAARMANIHTFIESLPSGYDTSLGALGAQISGGQKQRIAIARALIRRPRILLLDEATSALDTQSEKVVQQALDEASAGRTCIVIAHRLTTIQNADLICVVQHGKIMEQGTHTELLEMNGLYSKLCKMQPSFKD